MGQHYPGERDAIIRVAGKEAKLALNCEFSWTCDDEELEDRLNEFLRLIDRGYQPDYVHFFVRETAKHFEGEIVKIPPPASTKRHPPGTIY